MLTLSRQTAPSLPWTALLPREHGAYFQLALPLCTALAVSRPGPAALWLTAAVIACFLAHEPLLVVLGHRGPRRQEGAGAVAWRRGLTLAAVGAACLGLGALGLEAPARPWLALPLILGGEVLLMAWGHQERTLSGELLAALALGAWAVPVAVSGGLAPGASLALWGTFGLGFGLATLAVHLVVRAHKPHADRAHLRVAGAATAGLLLAGAVVWAGTRGLPVPCIAALVPTSAVALWACAALPSPRHLRALGFSFAGAGLLTAVLLCVGLR